MCSPVPYIDREGRVWTSYTTFLNHEEDDTWPGSIQEKKFTELLTREEQDEWWHDESYEEDSAITSDE